MEDGLWRVDCGGWIVEGGLWRVDYGGWIVEGGLWRGFAGIKVHIDRARAYTEINLGGN